MTYKNDLDIDTQVLVKIGELAFADGKKESTTTFLVSTIIDWENVYLLACRHQIRPLILRGVSRLPINLFPLAFIEKLKEDCQNIASHGLLHTKELLRLLTVFKINKVTVIPYKGIVLANAYYGGLGMREFSDIDLFIYEKDIAAIKKILIQEGYKPRLNLSDAQETIVKRLLCELNYIFFDAENKLAYHLEPHHKSNGMSDGVTYFILEDFEERLKTIRFLQREIASFSTEDHLILLLIHHGSKEGWALLKYIFDVYAIIQQEHKNIDWGYIVEKIKQLQINDTFYIGINLLHELFDLSNFENIPPKSENSKIIELTNKRCKGFHLLSTKNSPLKMFYYNLQSMDNWKNRLKIVTYRLFYPHYTDILFIKLPRPLFFLYFLIRPFRGIVKSLFART